MFPEPPEPVAAMCLDQLSDPVARARLKSDIVPPPERSLRQGRREDLALHMAVLRQSFAGQPELCVAHAELIVRLRRRMDVPTTQALFFGLWEDETAFLCRHLNSRWLISACDTYGDFGAPLQRSQAMTISAVVNTLKMAETERRYARDPRPDPVKREAMIAQRRRGQPERLWDGITTYAVFGGDMPRNLFARIKAIADSDPVLGPITRTLLARAADGENLLSRMATLNDRFWQDRA